MWPSSSPSSWSFTPPSFFSSQSSQQISSNNNNNNWTSTIIQNTNTISYSDQKYVIDKKNKVSTIWNQMKGKIKNNFGKSVYKPLSFYEFHMIQHLYVLVKQVPMNKLAESIVYEHNVPSFLSILNFTRSVVMNSNNNQGIKMQIVTDIDKLIGSLQSIKFSQKSRQNQCYTEMQTYILFMIFTFISLQTNYNPYKRSIIKNIFNQLSSTHFLNIMQTLRYFQNQRIQVQKLTELSQQVINQSINEINMKTYYFYNSQDHLPAFTLKRVSPNSRRRKVINLLISGFLSEGMDKKTQWQSLLDCMPDSQVYGLDWQSQKMNNLVTFMAGSVKDLIFTNTTLADKFVDNPFNPAFKIAQDTGRYLAHIVHELFPYQFINIIGYSLGTQLIKQFIKTSYFLNGGRNLQRIVLCGGVSDANQYIEILNNFTIPISITNLYTGNDTVLQILLKRCRPGINPIGLNDCIKSSFHYIENTDVSDYIMGHLSYMMNFGKIGQLLELNQE